MSGRAGLVNDVVGVEVTTDGMLVVTDRLYFADFPTELGIRINDSSTGTTSRGLKPGAM